MRATTIPQKLNNLGAPDKKRQDTSNLVHENPPSLPVGRDQWSTATTSCSRGPRDLVGIYPGLMLSADPQSSSKLRCLNTVICESQRPANLSPSSCPHHHLKQPTAPLPQAFPQQICKVTSASEADVDARILFCSLMLFRLPSNYLTH